MRLKAAFLGLLLASAALACPALTLGRMRGAAWIGQGLDLIVPATLDASDGEPGLCTDADVFYADTRQESNRVQVRVEATGSPNAVNLHLSTSVAVDEPVVTVYLRAGCTARASRKFVLLADYPTDSSAAPVRAQPAPGSSTPLAGTASASVPAMAPAAAAPGLAPQNPVLSATEAPASATPASATPASAAQAVAAAASASSVPATPTAAAAPTNAVPHAAVRKAHPQSKPTAAKPAPIKAASAKPAPAKSAPSLPVAGNAKGAAATGKSRLQLDPLETLSERVATLEMGAASAPQAEQTQQVAQHIDQLQEDIKVLLSQAAKNEADLRTLRLQLAQAQSQTVPITAVYALLGAIALALAALVYLWQRRPRLRAWSEADAPNDATQPTSTPSATQPGTPRPAPAASAQPATAPAQAQAYATPGAAGLASKRDLGFSESELDVDLLELGNSTFSAMLTPQGDDKQDGAEQAGTPKLAQSRPGQFDFQSDAIQRIRERAQAQQQSGHFDAAIELLEDGIRRHRQESAQLFLDLFDIAHKNSLKTDYRLFRDQFHAMYCVALPDFALYRSEGRGVEAYPDLLEHVSRQWDQPLVLGLLEACMLRDTENGNSESFDIGTFRDLLLLHGIAHSRHFGENDAPVLLDINF